MFRNQINSDEKLSNSKVESATIKSVLESDSEDIIWMRFKEGSETALTYIYRNYSNLLFNYGSQFTKNRALLKDCLHDLFLELIDRRESLSPTTSIKFYLMKSFRNRLVKMIQKNSKRTEIEFQFQEEGFQVAISAEMRLIDGQLDHDKRKLLEQKLNELPPLQREALILYFYEGLKYQQIAEMLGIKTKSSRELVYRATNSLGTLLAPYRDSMISFAGIIAVMKNSL